MPLRRALGLAAKDLCLPKVEAARSGAATEESLRASSPALQFPADHYAHPGAPTEWYWHIGTLKAGDRTFGFEINAASYVGQGGFAFSQVMLTDVANARHYQRTTPFLIGVFDCATWASSDPSQDWYVSLGDPANAVSQIIVTNAGSGYTSAPDVTITGGGGTGASAAANLNGSGGIASIDLWHAGSGYTSAPEVTITGGGGRGATAQAIHSFVAMNASKTDPTQNMSVRAHLVDTATSSVITFDLTVSQEGPPFLVLGTGLIPVPHTCGSALQTNNFYYSLTRLHASGTITIDGEAFAVSGVTWMDHEYGAFASSGRPVKWILQDMQLDNGVCISNFSLDEPDLGEETQSIATVQYPGQPTMWVLTKTTPRKPWTSKVSGKTYFMELDVKIEPGLIFWWPEATLTVTSLVDEQEFPGTGSVYEGVASVTGVFNKQPVTGTAWNEQTAR